MSIRFFAALREIIGKKEETLDFRRGREVDIEKVLKRLAELHGKDFTEYVYDTQTGDVHGYLQILVNEKIAKALTTKLKDGDVLAIIPPVGGG